MNAISCRSDKLAIARLLAWTPWNPAARAVERRLGIIRVFNFHGTPHRYRESFGRQLDHLLGRYDAGDPWALEETLAAGLSRRRPLAIFTFDDGLQNHFTVAADELEARGVRGIFCIPVMFPSVPRAEQAGWFRTRVRKRRNAEHWLDEDLYAISWHQARELANRGHRICCHSLTHEILHKSTPSALLETEVVESRSRMEHELGCHVDGFCWPSERDPYASAALQLVRTTYSYALAGDTKPLRRGHDPLDVNRTRLEASWPLEVVDFQTSGLIDGVFMFYRWRSALRTA
jgi:peptidoglycan/xylan/chitin deacetylase (PgdA/CDA1 family)